MWFLIQAILTIIKHDYYFNFTIFIANALQSFSILTARRKSTKQTKNVE